MANKKDGNETGQYKNGPIGLRQVRSYHSRRVWLIQCQVCSLDPQKGRTMKKPKSTLTMLASAVLMVGMTVPISAPQANAQISIHLGWQQPPPDYNDVRRQGFHDGIDAARHDIDRGLPPDPHRHERFRHPPVGHHQRDDYRRGFDRGYHAAYEHRGR